MGTLREAELCLRFILKSPKPRPLAEWPQGLLSLNEATKLNPDITPLESSYKEDVQDKDIEGSPVRTLRRWLSASRERGLSRNQPAYPCLLNFWTSGCELIVLDVCATGLRLLCYSRGRQA